MDDKDQVCFGRPIVENNNKILEIVELDRHPNIYSIAQELMIRQKINLEPLA